MVFSIVKPFLHQMTLDKINIFGFDQKEWSAALLKEIDADQLPVQYGGTLTDLKASDPSKVSFFNQYNCTAAIFNFFYILIVYHWRRSAKKLLSKSC